MFSLQDFGHAHGGQHSRGREQRFDRDDVDIRHAAVRSERLRFVGLVRSLVFDFRVRTDRQRCSVLRVGHARLRTGLPVRIPEPGE